MNILLTAAEQPQVVKRIWNLVDWLIIQFGMSLNQSIFINITGAVLCILSAYLLGSLCPTILITKRFFGGDVRKFGSGTAGMRNTFECCGRGAAIGVFFADFFLGLVAVLVGRFFWAFNGAALACFFVILGNIFPAFHKMRGGKGVVTMLGAAFAIHPIVFALLLIIFLLAVLASKFVSFGSIAISFLFPLFVNAFANFGLQSAMAAFSTGFLIYAHWANVKLIQAGKERKFYFSEFFQKKRDGED